MKKLLVFACLPLFMMACGGGGSDVPNDLLNSTSEMAKSLPMISGAITASSVGVDALTFDTVADATHVAMIQDFFKLECHDDSGSINFCPSGVTADDTNKFTTTTLLGLVYHAEMKGKDIYGGDDTYKTCAKGETPTALTNHVVHYVLNDGSEGTDNPMVLPITDAFDCLGTFTYEGLPNYSAYHKAEAGNTFAYLTTRYQHALSGSVMSDVFEAYMSNASGSSILGFNLASFDDKTTGDYANRVVLIANATSHKFAVKMDNGYNKRLIAIGKGGYDSGTNTYVDGYFVVRTNDGTTTKLYCIKNAAAPLIVAATFCNDIVANLGTTSGNTWTGAAVATYLGLGTADATYLDSFINGDTYTTMIGVNNTDNITYPYAPCSADGSTCDDTHFPESLSAN